MTMSDHTVDFLRHRLDKAGIRTAVVVDDAFDAPTVSSLQNEMFAFWNRIERDDELQKQLESYGILAESEYEMTDEEIATLWCRRGECGQFIAHANRTLFENAKPAFEEVDQVVNSLRSLGLEVDPVGTGYSAQPPVPDLVFMDFSLDPSDRTSSKLSAQRAREIYDAAEEGTNKPFTVLMSSIPNVRSQADEFRDNSRLLGGLFDFVSKGDLNDPTRFAIRLATWLSNMSLRHRVQYFIETLDSTMRDRTREFMRKARSLTIEDYAFVQSLSLEDDGHPLGDYMQWLFSSLLVNKVLEKNDRFTDSKEEINRISADSQPPSQLFPSTQLAETYSIAIAEQGLEEIESHSRVGMEVTGEASDADPDSSGEDASRSGTNTSQVKLPKLRLGDLLVHNDGRRVHMIATPDCDLQFAPNAGRVPEEGESVMLVPGWLQPLREPIGRGHIQTELYFHDGEQCRIAWERKKIITVPVAKFLEWCTDKGYSRPARIRLPYAVKIQQEVIAGFSRVGMPVAPPLQDFAPVEVYYEGTDGTWESLDSALDPGVNVIYADQGTPTFVLTPAALNDLLKKLTTLIGMYRRFLQGEMEGIRKQQLTSKLNRLRRCVEEPENLVQMLEVGRNLPDSGRARQLMGDTIALHRNGDFGSGCRSNHVVCLNIIYD